MEVLFIWRVKVWGVWGERELHVKAKTSEDAVTRAKELEPNAVQAVAYEVIGTTL